MSSIFSFLYLVLSTCTLNIVSCTIGPSLARVAVKTLTSILFLGTGIIATKESGNKASPYAKLMITGLILGLGGDVFLGLDYITPLCFVIGLILFALGHVFYLIAFFRITKFNWYNLIPTLIVMPTFFLLKSIPGLLAFNGLFLAVAIYGFILTFMVGKSLSLQSWDKNKSRFVKLTITGSILFAVSDIILLFILFMPAAKSLANPLTVLNLSTYYMGQGLLALSLRDSGTLPC